MTKYHISLSAVFFALVCHGQKKTITTIQFPASINVRNVRIEYDDGREIIRDAAIFGNNKVTISGTFYSKYATLEIRYFKTPSSFHSIEYFLKEGRSSLVFAECRNGDSLAFPFDSCKLFNAIEIRKLPEAKKLDSFTRIELEDLNDFNTRTGDNDNDSLTQVLVDKVNRLLKKRLEFVKQNHDSYYSLWLFRRKFLGFGFIQANFESLSKTFASFPVNLRNSVDGKEISKTINGAMYSKKGYPAPAFTAKDITGATIDLNSYKGKYVLLQFWASWCVPCIEEMPAIKKISDRYSSDKLKVISISIDKDSSAFVNGMQVHNMNWINIFDHRRFLWVTYGVKPIPSVYLIDKEGKIVYSSWEDNLEVLNDILSKSLN